MRIAKCSNKRIVGKELFNGNISYGTGTTPYINLGALDGKTTYTITLEPAEIRNIIEVATKYNII